MLRPPNQFTDRPDDVLLTSCGPESIELVSASVWRKDEIL